MAHFAELDKNKVVLRVIVVNNEDIMKDGVEDEATGIAFCQNLLGGDWKQTSYNNNFRKHYAGIGSIYDSVLDAFYSPQPYPSWSLDSDCNWQPPIPMPTDGSYYNWNEENQTWNLVE